MIERLPDMPPGVIGFSATGNVDKADYRDVLAPALREAAEGGAEVRILFVVGPEFKEYERSALVEDAKVGLDMELVHRANWKRSAVVTDIGWITKAFHLFAWLAPGEVRCVGLDKLEEAKAWVAGSD